MKRQIGVLVPLSSRGFVNDSQPLDVGRLPVVNVLLPSLVGSSGFPVSPLFDYHFLFGVDRGDPLELLATELEGAFRAVVGSAPGFQLFSFDDTAHAPSWAVSHLADLAVAAVSFFGAA